MERQYFDIKANENDYDDLFRLMSPIPTVFWCRPGEAPSIYFRTDFNDLMYNHRRRESRIIVKGRFQNGSIAYVEKKELELFAALYRKPLIRKTDIQIELQELLEREGPMNIKVIKEMTGLLVKQITPALHRLQEAFIVYEDQVDNDWDRGWYLFKSEFPDLDLNRYTKDEALQVVILRFGKLNVWFDPQMVNSFYKLPIKDIIKNIDSLVDKKILIEHNNGYMLKSDYDFLQNIDIEVSKSVYLLHRNDYLVKANEHILKEKFKNDKFTVLQYLLIDGEIKGAVVGKIKNGPFILEDIVLDLSIDKIGLYKDAIIEAVYMVNSHEHSPIKKFNGEIL